MILKDNAHLDAFIMSCLIWKFVLLCCDDQKYRNRFISTKNKTVFAREEGDGVLGKKSKGD